MDGIDCPNYSMQLLSQLHSLKKTEFIAYYPQAGRGKTRVRRLTQISPYLVSQNWGVHNNSYQNLVRAIHERVFMVNKNGVFQRPPQPTHSIRKKLGEFKRRILHNIESIEPLSTKQFVDTYVGRKRKLYERAVKSLEEKPLRKADAYIKAFIKDEKTDFGSKPNACPRIIQPRSPRFNVAVGVYLKPMEKALYRAIACVYRGVTVFKGLNGVRRGYELRRKWDRFDHPVAVGVDASRWDQHCSREVIDWEHSLEEAIFPQMKQFNDMRKVNRVYAQCDDGEVHYQVEGCRMSGDMDTAMGNCLLMCAITWTVMKDLQLEKYEYVNDGDDGVLIVERSELEVLRQGFVKEFGKYGYTMKWESETEVFEEIEFCQCQPVYDGERYVMCRKPMRTLMTNGVTLKRYRNTGDIEDLVNSIGWCGLAIAGNLPIYWQYYYKMARKEYSPTLEYDSGLQYLAHGLIPVYKRPTAAARHSFWLAFHVSPEAQICIEKLILDSKVEIRDPIPGTFLDADETIKILLDTRNES